jgi:hypothetical protein
MYRDFRIVVGSRGIGRATQDEVQQLQTALGSPEAYASGGPPAMEGGLTNPTSSHRNWTTDGGHVTVKRETIKVGRFTLIAYWSLKALSDS